MRCQKGNGLALSFRERWPKESPLLRYGDKSNEDQVDTFPINRHRTKKKKKFSSSFGFLPIVLLSAEKREIYSYFFLSFSSCLNCQGSHVFFWGPPTTQHSAVAL